MKCLFLDPASNIGALACVTDDKASVCVEMDKRITDSQIVPLVEKTMNDAGWSYKDLTHIACVTGPGGFTSLRTGIAFSNVLIDQLGVPAVGIHLSDLYEARLRLGRGALGVGEESDALHPTPPSFLWLHSTRIDQCFVRGFGKYAEQWNDPTLIDVAELASVVPSGALWAGELIPQHQEKLKMIVKTDAKPLAEMLPGYLSTLSFEKKPLLPWYGRTW